MIFPIKQIKRYLKAKSLNFRFIRTKSFQIPNSIKIQNISRKLDLPDTPGYIELFRDIILDDEYYLNLLKSNDIQNIVDVGANLGIFSIAARLTFPNSEIHAYEPNNDNISHLKKHAEEFLFKYYEEAVSDEVGFGDLSFSSKHDTAATINKNDQGVVRLTNIETLINRFKKKKIDLLKLDCEGSEFDILQKNNSFNDVRYITLEYHLPLKNPDERLNELYEILSKQNFTIIKQNRRNVCLGNILAKNDK